MKRLRILTGLHAGASADLPAGVHTIGRDDSCDLALTDWPEAAVQLHVDADGSARLQPAGTALTDFEPQTFGAVVLCIGPADAAWPADLELLGHALQPAPARAARRALARLRPLPARAAVGALMLLSAGAAVVTSLLPLRSSTASELAPPSLEQVRTRLQAELAEAGASTLQVHVLAGQQSLVIEGLLDSAARASRVRAAVEQAASPYPVLRHDTTAEAVADSIRGAMGVPGANVQHLGDGVFRFAADVADPERTRAELERVARDLVAVVRRIEPALGAVEGPKADRPLLSAMTIGHITVVQTRDGQKHISVGVPPATVGVAEALMTAASAPTSNPPPVSGQP